MTDLDNVDASRTPTASQSAGLTLAAARRAIAAVEVFGHEIGVPFSTAVVDSGDQLVAFARMDGADLVTLGLARDKAFSALMNRMPTADLAPLVQPGAEFFGYDALAGGRMVVFGGGAPVELEGILVGAIGVSGGSSAEDQQAADAALGAIRQRA